MSSQGAFADKFEELSATVNNASDVCLAASNHQGLEASMAEKGKRYVLSNSVPKSCTNIASWLFDDFRLSKMIDMGSTTIGSLALW